MMFRNAALFALVWSPSDGRSLSKISYVTHIGVLIGISATVFA